MTPLRENGARSIRPRETVMGRQVWPRLRVADWHETRDTLHMWMQIVGKVRLAHAPLMNRWWNVTLYVSSRGLTTSAIPYGAEAFDVELAHWDRDALEADPAR
ncbi:DUF5996 family protein [Streptosporangium sp. NPDC000396]|uniref:DUF5996 family protein n=1 Tax=Streptosporangium sp. NPDC000396 TaxID=3366185 RepID=UPI0036A059F6